MAISAPMLRIGDIDIWPLLDGRLTIAEPPNLPAPETPEFAIYEGYIRDGVWHMDIGGFLVRSGDRLILVDAGSGPGDEQVSAPALSVPADDPGLVEYVRERGATDPAAVRDLLAARTIRTGSLGASLAAVGFAPEDVTDVVLSHLHFDHIGWVSKDGRPYFPNAVVRCEQGDADYFLSEPHENMAHQLIWNALPTTDRMGPILDRFEPWTEDAEFAPGVGARFTPGHTPGSCVFSIKSGHEHAVILGDSIHCPQELVDPDDPGSSNVDQALRDRSVNALREQIDDGRTLLSAPHFDGLRFGRLKTGAQPRTWSFEWAS